jgi:multidrug resistance efflux pump
MPGWDRIFKLLLAFVIVVSSVGYYAHDRLSPSASYAVVVAPAPELHAPGDGRLSFSLRSFAMVPAGTELAKVTPEPRNDPELRAAMAELETVRAEVDSLRSLAEVADGMGKQTRGRQALLEQRRLQQLERLERESNAALATRQAVLHGSELARSRANELCSANLLPTRDCEAVQSQLDVNQAEVERAQEQVGLARFLLASSRSGVDIGQDIASEATYTRQHGEELALRLASLKQQLATKEASLKALELRTQPPPFSIAVGAPSRVWSATRENGAMVVKGELLFRLAACDRMYVLATVPDHHYADLRVGQVADVKVRGKHLTGTISRLLGPAGFSTREQVPDVPAVVDRRDATNSVVALDVTGLATLLGPRCEVGTRAEVDFSSTVN